jgi:hypothetical protein
LKVGRPATPPSDDPFALEIDRDAVLGQRAVGEAGDALGAGFVTLDVERLAPVMLDREGDVGPRHGEALHHVEAGGIFGARRAQELAARGDAGEQLLDADARARRQRGGAFGDHGAVIDDAAPALGTAHPAFETHPRDAGDRGQGLAAKAQRRDLVDLVIGQLGGGVALQCERHIGRRHAAAVVGHFDEIGAAAGQFHGDPGGPGIDCVFDQFFQRAGRAFDHFSRCNSVDKMFGETAY